MKFLRNSVDKIDAPNGLVWIVGIDADAEGAPLNKDDLSFLRGRGPAIILSHSPLVFDLIDDD